MLKFVIASVGILNSGLRFKDGMFPIRNFYGNLFGVLRLMLEPAEKIFSRKLLFRDSRLVLRNAAWSECAASYQ